MRTYLVGLVLALVLVGGVACSSEERASQEPPDPGTSRDAERTAAGTTEGADDGSTESSAPSAPEGRDKDRGDAPQGGGAQVADLLAQDPAPSPPAPGYALVRDPSGALTVEVPVGWEHEAGYDPDIGGVWSRFGGEGSEPSITAATDVEGWYVNEPVKGADVVASRDMARYTDDELVASGGNELSLCEPGASSDYRRGAYSGRMQAWGGCLGDPGISAVTLSAAPEGRECVVVLHVLMLGEGDVEAGQHVLDTFEVDCGAVPSDAQAAAAEDQYAPEAQYGAGTNCSDFVTMYGEPSQWQAQQFYDGIATPEERAALDPDGDGFACSEGNPTAAASGATPDNPAYPGAEGCVNPGPCGVNPVEDPGDNVDPETGLVVGDDTPDCATPEQVLASGLCKNVIVGAGP